MTKAACQLPEHACLLPCRLLEQKGPFWARQYLFWHNERPLTAIHEVFSPTLDKFLGPSNAEPPSLN